MRVHADNVARVNVSRNAFFSLRSEIEKNKFLWCCYCGNKILTIVMTRIVVDKSTDHAKPHSICLDSPNERRSVFIAIIISYIYQVRVEWLFN